MVNFYLFFIEVFFRTIASKIITNQFMQSHQTSKIKTLFLQKN